LSEAWFDEIIKYNHREQIPFSFLVWKTEFRLGFFPGHAVDDRLVKWPDFIGHRIPRGFKDEDYIRLHPDVVASGMTPREHYLKVGADEGRGWL
jgi:hypothetical protein